MAEAPDHYRALGLIPSARPHQIRKAYVDLARLLHPDHHVATTDAERALAQRRMREINEAWAVLGDPESRARYDRELGNRRRHTSGTATKGRAGEVGSGATSTEPLEPVTVPGSFDTGVPTSPANERTGVRGSTRMPWVALAALVAALGAVSVVAVDSATSDRPPAQTTTTIPVPGG